MISEMAGPVALHGGGEFLPGDEPFLRALLDAAAVQANERGGLDEPIRVAVMPTAAAGQSPDVAARFGTTAFERLADAAGRQVNVETARVVDASSADDAGAAATLEAADLIYLPGGDPHLIPTLLPGTAAWRAMEAANRRGAVLAGASAGAMGLCQLTWTPRGVIPGLGVVHGLVVVPHADAAMWDRQSGRFAMASAVGVGVLGIGERTGVISPARPAMPRTAKPFPGWSSGRARSAGSPMAPPSRGSRSTARRSNCPCKPPRSTSAGVLQPGRDPVDGQLDEPEHGFARGIVGFERAEPGEQAHLELRERVDIRVAQRDRTLEHRRVVE